MSELNNGQRKRIRKIASDWRKGKLTAKQLHDRARDIEGWPEHRQQILAELDQVASQSVSNRLKKYAPVVGVVLGLVLIAAIALIAPRLTLSTEKTDESQETSIAQAPSTPTITLSPEPTYTFTPTFSPTPTPAATSTSSPTPSPTITPSPEPSPTHTPTPSPTPVPPPPAPALSVSGVVKAEGIESEELSQVKLVLASESDGTLTPLATDSPDQEGNFALQVQESPGLAYRLKVEAPSGMYVKEITPGDSDWQPVTHTITGFTTGLRSKEPINQTTISGIQVMLSAVPEIPSEQISGDYIDGSWRQPNPYDDDKNRSVGEVMNSVTILGQWINNEKEWLWHLVCCQKITTTQTIIDEHFWVHWSESHGVSVAAEYTEMLPFIYFPSQFSIDEPPEQSGWMDTPVDGLTVVSSRQPTSSQPITLEWRIEGLQGWFRLEAWAPRRSQKATYQVFVEADANSESLIKPLAGIQIVPAVLGSESSSFKSIGTYHLAQEGVLVIRLEVERKDVKAGFIRVIKPTD